VSWWAELIVVAGSFLAGALAALAAVAFTAQRKLRKLGLSPRQLRQR
jgi:hypothetical protein